MNITEKRIELVRRMLEVKRRGEGDWEWWLRPCMQTPGNYGNHWRYLAAMRDGEIVVLRWNDRRLGFSEGEWVPAPLGMQRLLLTLTMGV